jgi:phosphoglycerol transferase MdoB-like AlkP superfamily enzyme
MLSPARSLWPVTHRSESLYRRLLTFAGIGLLVFLVLRLLLWGMYRADFSDLSLWQLIEACAVGVRFDASLLAWVLWLPYLFLLFPFPWSGRVGWQRFWGWWVFAGLVVLVFATIADTLYFGTVHRHVGPELGVLAADMRSMLSLAGRQYALHLLGFAFLVAGSAWLWARLLRPVCFARGGALVRTLLAFILSFGMLVAVRGGIGGKPISVGDAFFSNTLSQGYLAMNGAFAVSRGLLDQVQAPAQFMPQTSADLRSAQWFSEPGHTPNPEFPLWHEIVPSAHDTVRQKPNVVVLMLESWGAVHVDAMRRSMGLPALGLTPNFDSLAQQGRLYTHFYANGQRSIQGTAALLSGMPIFPGMPMLGEGMEQNRLSYLGTLAQAHGYDTYFLQSSERFSLRLDVVAQRAGFVHYSGAEDIPERHAVPKPIGNWGTWDHNMFQEANRQFAAAKQPFVGFLFSSSTHAPWLIPDDKWKQRTDGSPESQALNALYYADWALGEFIASAKKAGYFENTLFFITADHTNEFVTDVKNAPNLFHIPLLVIGPGVVPGIDTRIGSQVDVMPTIADAAAWRAPYAAMGMSLLSDRPPQRRAALAMRDQVLTWISEAGWVSHNLDHQLAVSPQNAQWQAAQVQEAQANMLALYQSATHAQLKNRLAPR